MNIIAHNLQEINAKINAAKLKANRQDSVLLLAVSKAKPAEAVREAFESGQTAFGENYLQEALNKQLLLSDLAIDWHFIGPIQSNKTTPIAENFSWVHGVDRLKIAERLNAARPATLSPLSICIQVNVSAEDSKAGVALNDVEALARAILPLTHLKLRGLMAIPAPTDNRDLQHAQFRLVRDCYTDLIAKGFTLDTLSMGMSDDYLVAIEEGANIVRIGSAIFGARL